MNDLTDRTDPTNRTPQASTRKWCEDLVFELRVLNVRGTRIGDEVAAVTSHCAESGQTPQEAFGHPTDYARSLTFGPADLDRATPADLLRYGASSILGLLGFALGQAAFGSWQGRTDTPVTWGAIVAGAILALTCVVVVALLGPILRRRWVGGPVLTVALAGMVGALVVLREPALLMPTVPALVGAGLLLLASVVVEYTVGTPGDPVVDPVDGSDRYPDRTGALGALGRALRPWFWPLATAVFIGIDIALHLT